MAELAVDEKLDHGGVTAVAARARTREEEGHLVPVVLTMRKMGKRGKQKTMGGELANIG